MVGLNVLGGILLGVSIVLSGNYCIAEGPTSKTAESQGSEVPTPTPDFTPTPVVTPTPEVTPTPVIPQCPPHVAPTCNQRRRICLENPNVNLNASNLQDTKVITNQDAIATDEFGNKGWYARTSKYRRSEGFAKGEQGFRDWLLHSAYTKKFSNYCWLCACIREWDGCFPPGTMITLFDGTLKPIEEIAAGDMLLSPVRGGAVKVKRIIEGPEKEGLIEYGYKDIRARVTQKHPVYTKKGLKTAQQLTLSDELLAKDGSYHRVERINLLPVVRGQMVINVELEAADDKPESRLLVADGVVVGDMELQSTLGK